MCLLKSILHRILIISFLLIPFALCSQLTIEASRVDEPINIDGQLTDPAWDKSSAVSNFITWQPVPGLEPDQQTEVRLLYDDVSLYVGIRMQVPGRDSIMTELSQRDDLGNTDFVGLLLDTYKNGTDAFEFIVGATGVQFDAKLTQNGEDTNWDAVWFSDVHLSDKYWSVELKIPYSAIRFSIKRCRMKRLIMTISPIHPGLAF